MKNQKGITLITLSIILIVMSIIAGVVTYSGMESVNNAKRTAFISELEMIQANVNTIYEKRKLSQEDANYYNQLGIDISEIEDDKVTIALGGTSKEGFRYFYSSDLRAIGLENIDRQVLINYDTREVVSITGIKIDGVMYYKLKDIPNYSGYNVDYINKNTQAPTFTVEKTKLSDSYRFTLKDIVYNSNVEGGTVSYKLHNDTNWILNGTNTSFEVTEPGLYDIRFIDKAGNSTVVQDWVYVYSEVLAYYDAENNTGNGHNNTATVWKDLSRNGNDASLTNINNTDASGWKEKAIQLDGVDDEVIFPVSRPVAGTFSVEIILTEQNYLTQGILDTDKHWKSFVAHTWNDNGDIYIGGNYAYANSENDRVIPTEINFRTTIGKTDSFVYTYNGSTRQATFYANGNKLAQKTFTADPEEIEYFKIVSSQKMYSRISFYDRTLTESEVKTNFIIDQYRFNIE